MLSVLSSSQANHHLLDLRERWDHLLDLPDLMERGLCPKTELDQETLLAIGKLTLPEWNPDQKQWDP